jgi:oligoribonuclease NrnB/cAMP/cGMP phosphodiesterase (DHH superfamily)
MKCFYHDDLDGQASAFCVYAWVGVKSENGVTNMPEFIEINYGKVFPFESIKKDEQIWIVDYSISPEEMLKLLNITKDVTWIDHHKTAIEKYSNFPEKIRGIRRDGEATCVLTWKYIHWFIARGSGEEDLNRISEELKIPRCIELTGDRDVWVWRFGEETKNFFNGSQLYDTSPSSDFWWKCMDFELDPTLGEGNFAGQKQGKIFWDNLLNAGKIIEQFKQSTDKGINNSLGWETIFEGYKCWAINRARTSSDRYGNRIKEYDILLPYFHDGNQFTVSLYSEKVDVSTIAKKHGGGGHKKASGFQCETLPFNILKD